MDSSSSFDGRLDARLVRPPLPARVRSVRVPGLGRVMFTRDPGDSTLLASEVFASRLHAVHRSESGVVIGEHDLGSGLVTNVGVNLMANDWTLATAPILKNSNFHAIGTGATGAAATDFYLQTAQGTTNVSGTTNGYMTGTQSWVSPNIYRTVSTFTFTGNVSVTEWVLANANGTAFTGRSSSATGNNTLTDSGAAFTTAGNGLMGWSVEVASSVVNTPTSTVMGQIASNTATVLTILGGSGSGQWLTLANASASNPASVSAYVVYPSVWDHKVFSVISAVNGDTITFTYSLTVNSGG